MQELIDSTDDFPTFVDDEVVAERMMSPGPRNTRRSIEEMLEQRALRSILRDLDQDFPED